MFAFAGTINSPGYAQLLRSVAERIATHDGELLIFGPIAAAQAAAVGLDLPNIRLGGLLKADELMLRLRAEADVLFVPMSFAPEDRDNMRMGFPEQAHRLHRGRPAVVDRRPAGLFGRALGQAHPGVAEVVTTADPRCPWTGNRSPAAAIRNIASPWRRPHSRSAIATSRPRPRRRSFKPLFDPERAASMSRPTAVGARPRRCSRRCACCPRAVAGHMMFLLNTRPAIADSWGYHVRPIHYYEPLPDFRGIRSDRASRRRVSSAIDFDLDGQRRLVRRLGEAYRAEIEALAAPGAL